MDPLQSLPSPSQIAGAALDCRAVTNPFLEPQVEPVRVIESIPVAGSTNLPPEVALAERIPTPSHLLVARALARGGMGHVHPATDRNLLRHVAMKRLMR